MFSRPHTVFEVGTLVKYFTGSYTYGIVTGMNDFEKNSAPLIPKEKKDYEKGILVCTVDSTGRYSLVNSKSLVRINEPLQELANLDLVIQGAQGYEREVAQSNRELLEQVIIKELTRA